MGLDQPHGDVELWCEIRSAASRLVGHGPGARQSHETAAKIRAAGGHYVFTVRANRKHLYQQLEALPWKGASASVVSKT